MAHDVFISYTTKNKQVADAICSALEQRKMRCWIAPRDVPPGGNYGEAIVHAISSCQVVVLIYSAAVNLSAAVMREAERAMHNAKPIIPFRLEDVPMQPGLEFFLASCHWLDAIHPPMEEHIQRLGDAVEALMGREVERPVPFPVTATAPVRRARAPWLPVLLGGALVAGGAALVVWKPWQSPQAGTTPVASSSESAKAPSLAIALAGAGENVIAGHFQQSAPGVIRYRSSEDAGTLKIVPLLPQQPPLLAGDGKGGPFKVDPVFLEAKLMNPGSGTIFIHTATLKVESSTPVQAPLWYLDAKGLPAYVELAAVGGGAPPQATLQYKLLSPEDPTVLAGAQPIPRPDTGRWRIPLENGKELLGSISGGDINPLQFELPKNPKAAPPPPPQPPASTPKDSALLKLQDDGKDYTVQSGVSENLRSGEGSRMFFWLMGESWSRHRFKLVLDYDDGSGGKKSLETGWVELEIFSQ